MIESIAKPFSNEDVGSSAGLRGVERQVYQVKPYTGTGDDGFTGLLGGKRVPKHDLRPEAYGTVDELSSALGLARSTATSDHSRQILLSVQRRLYHLMTELAATREAAGRFRKTTSEDVTELENLIDGLAAKTEIPTEFIVPGDTVSGSALDLARAVARRAERVVAHLIHAGEFENREVLRYLNRLSSLLFVLARFEDTKAGVGRATLARDERE
jgi:cob(I)alamin adenosyltransferase